MLKVNDSVGRRAVDEFSDEGAPDIVLFARPESTGHQTPQPGNIAWYMDVACETPCLNPAIGGAPRDGIPCTFRAGDQRRQRQRCVGRRHGDVLELGSRKR